MQTSDTGKRPMNEGVENNDHTGKRRGLIKGLVTVACCVAIAILADVALSFLLEPYSSHSDVIWQDYRSRSDEPIDTIFLGSSSTEMGLNPEVVDEQAGTYSFNLATPAAGINNCRDTLRDVLSDHDIKRIVVGVNYVMMTSKHEIDATIAITQAKMQGASLAQDLTYIGEVFTDRQTMLGIKSLAALVPWCVLHVDYSRDAIEANVNRRRTMTEVEAATAYQYPWLYICRGFNSFPGGSLGFNNVTDNIDSSENGLEFSEENVEALLEICNICQENGIECIVYVPPRPAYRTLMYGQSYPENMSSLQRMVEESGASYVDFNMAKPELYNPTEAEFRDEYHLTLDAAESFSQVAGGIFADVWSGEGVADKFFSYDKWEDYLDSLDADDFSPAFYAYEVNDGSVDIHPWSLTGPNVTTEYQVEVKEAGEIDFTVLKQWCDDADCTYQTSGHGEITVRVMARPAGVEGAAEHICDKTFAY